MEKKESPKAPAAAVQPQKSGAFYNPILSLIELILGVCLLPACYAVAGSFLKEFSLIEKTAQYYFWAGAITLMMVSLLFWEPAVIYAKGSEFLGIIFGFSKSLAAVISFLVPVYALILFVVYIGLPLIIEAKAGWGNYFIFFFGMSVALHIIFSIKALRAKEKDFLKADYIFGSCAVFIVAMAFTAFCLSLLFKEFSYMNFSNNSYRAAHTILGIAFKQLFL